MNISELARRLHVQPQVLLELLPRMGFDIGKRAIKVDPRTAQRIIREWKFKIAELEREHKLQQATAEREQRRAQQTEAIALPALITVREFSQRLDLPVTSIMKELMRQGILATVNELIDYETASIIAQDLGFRTEAQKESLEQLTAKEPLTAKSTEAEREESGSVRRPPVVVVMGHIDHGKTKLLDAIRKTHVVEQEHGGITQHIGAYQIALHDRPITFIDTPGHEAFMTMRARGARIADIAILVVAADDGVKPQTVEAIRIIQGAELPMVVAINKIDKPEANLEKTKKELADHGVLGEGWGGSIPMVPISAKEGKGIAELLEVILLVADLHAQTLRANPDHAARGTIIEARVDKQEGVVATILVQQGTLRKNDPIVVNGTLYGKVRLMRDDRGGALDQAPPSTPVRILGLKLAPAVGDIAEVSEEGETLKKSGAAGDRSRQLLDAFARAASPEKDKRTVVIPLIIKADVLGSLEAILSEIQKIEHPEVGLKVVHRGLGMVTDADITRAQDTGATVIAFNVNALPSAANLARQQNIAMRHYTVIYALLEELKSDLEKRLAPEIRKVIVGSARILKVFKHEGKSWTVGSRVLEGRFVPKDTIEIRRAEEVLGRATLYEIQSGKQPVKEVGSGQECGMRLESRVEITEGDILESYREEKIERTLETKS